MLSRSDIQKIQSLTNKPHSRKSREGIVFYLNTVCAALGVYRLLSRLQPTGQHL